MIDPPVDIITQQEDGDAALGIVGYPFWQASSGVSMYLVRVNASQL